MDDALIRLTVDLSPNAHKKLRLLATHNNVSMAQMMRIMIDGYFNTLAKNGLDIPVNIND